MIKYFFHFISDWSKINIKGGDCTYLNAPTLLPWDYNGFTEFWIYKIASFLQTSRAYNYLGKLSILSITVQEIPTTFTEVCLHLKEKTNYKGQSTTRTGKKPPVSYWRWAGERDEENLNITVPYTDGWTWVCSKTSSSSNTFFTSFSIQEESLAKELLNLLVR